MSPYAPAHPCAQPGCSALVERGRCKAHQAKRPGSTRQGYDRRWRKARLAFLAANPFCAECGEAAAVVDHIQPHHGDAVLFWNQGNWQPLCKRDHDRKTRREGMGNEVRS